MATPIKTPLPAFRPAAVASEDVNIGDYKQLSSGFNIPDGSYACFFNIVMHAGFGKDTTRVPRLVVMLDAFPLDHPVEKPFQVALGLGRDIEKSFAPNPVTGKGLVRIPGGPGTMPYTSTNYGYFLKSLYDCGLPEGVLSNDFSVIDGVHLHLTSQPEPEERKGFVNTTAEVQEPRKDAKITVVTEILDGGKPWEGTGGMPVFDAAPKAAPAPKVASKPAPAKVAGKPVPVAAPVAAPVALAPTTDTEVDEAIQTAAITAASEVITQFPNGTTKTLLKTRVKTALAGDPDLAAAVDATYLADDNGLATLLGFLGYALKGPMVVVAA